MKPLSGKEPAKILENNRWKLARVHGSHYIYTKIDRNERITVPVHGNKPLKPGLQNYLIKAARIAETSH